MSLQSDVPLDELARMSVKQLRCRYREVFGEPTLARHKQWLVKQVAWRLQAADAGGLSERARRRARELAGEGELRLSPPRSETKPAIKRSIAPQPRPTAQPPATIETTVLYRTYKGRMLEVRVLSEGFEFETSRFSSLSAVAKHITGCHCSGNLFFGLRQRSSPK